MDLTLLVFTCFNTGFDPVFLYFALGLLLLCLLNCKLFSIHWLVVAWLVCLYNVSLVRSDLTSNIFFIGGCQANLFNYNLIFPMANMMCHSCSFISDNMKKMMMMLSRVSWSTIGIMSGSRFMILLHG